MQKKNDSHGVAKVLSKLLHLVTTLAFDGPSCSGATSLLRKYLILLPFLFLFSLAICFI